MAKHMSGWWNRIRDSIANDPGQFAGGSAVTDMLGLLAVERQRLATRRRAKGLGVPGAAEAEGVRSTLETRLASDVGDIE